MFGSVHVAAQTDSSNASAQPTSSVAQSILSAAQPISSVAQTDSSTDSSMDNPTVEWDSKSLIFGGRRVMGVMGEVHYSRIPADEWQREVAKMKEGGLTMIATYVFWNHHEETEGVYDWSGQRDLRRFLEICKDADMPVIVRLGPFCHGEVRCGGIPDWMFTKGCKIRDENKTFMHHVERLYRQIYAQVQGLQWKDGGPVIAVQFDNEYRGKGSYLMALKKMALEIGFDLPFYTRTGWPELRTPVPYGEMIPLYGDYADGFWERGTREGSGNYYKAFNFKAFRNSTAIATEQLGAQDADVADADKQYPYFTCELGGGMMTAYHRRPYLYPHDAYSMAVVKMGSGSNLLGYYMYHGGTNPEGRYSYLNEHQRTPATNYNDMPSKNYDFQAPLGEFGQRNPHYYTLRKLHLFMHDYGEMLAPMEATFPCEQELAQGDDTELRWSYRSEGESGFVFVNNYERFANLGAKKGVRFDVCGVTFPSRKITIPAGTTCIFPVNIDGIRYATAQLIAKRDGKIYMEQIEGIATEICVDGKVMRNVKPRGTEKPIYKNIYLLDSDAASRLFISEESTEEQPEESTEHRTKSTEEQPEHRTKSTEESTEHRTETVEYRKTKEAGPLRQITIGVQKVAEAPTDDDFADAAVYTITLPKERDGRLLDIEYRGDVARLYANGKLIADNFYNGRPMLMALWRLPQQVEELELRILPLQKDMPVYFPREADIREGEEVLKIITKTYK